jgi:hypothetical protein
MQRQNQADVDWARRTASRFGNPEVVRAELDEQAKLVEREKTRPTRTHDLWKQLLNCLKFKVRAFNLEYGEEFIRCERGRGKFSIALPPSTPMSPYDTQSEAVQVSLRYDHKRLLFHLAHSDRPKSSIWAFRPNIEGGRGDVEVCIVIGRRDVITFMNMSTDEAAESVVECLLRVSPPAQQRRAF